MIKIGQKKYGITVLREATKEERDKINPNDNQKYYLCECCCHNFYFMNTAYMERGNRSCGCTKNSDYPKNGLIYGVVDYYNIYKK